MVPARWLAGLSLLGSVGFAAPVAAEPPVTIVVEGEARPDGELAREPFVAASRVKRERLAAPAARAADVLRSEAGVQITEAGGLGAPATASIRGATAAQTPVYLAGVKLNDEVGGAADLSTIPLWLIDHVDVYRGNAPLEAELGIGGAIFFEPKRPRKPEASAGLTLGSFGTRAGFGYVAAASEQLQVLGGVSAERAENDYPFLDDRGTLFESADDSRRRRSGADSRVVDAWLLARARASRRVALELLVNGARREQGAPKLSLVPSERARAELSRTLVALSARIGFGSALDKRLTLRTAFVDAKSALHDPALELGLLARETRVRGGRSEQQVSLALPLAQQVELALSLDSSLEQLERRDGGAQLVADSLSLGAAGKAEWQLGRGLSLRGLLATRCRATSPGGEGCRDATPVGRLGLGLRGAHHSAYLNAGRYQRQPTLGELYGAGILVRGNDQLRRELGLSLDLGARGVWRASRELSLSADASGYARRASDLVTYARTAQGFVVPVNIGGARVAGVELTARAVLFERFSAGGNLTLVDARDTTEGRRLRNDILPFTSRLSLSPRLGASTGPLGGRGLARAELELELTYLSNRFADAAGLIVIPEQTTLGVSASAAWLGGALLTRARLANALDARRFDVVGYPLPGQSLYISAEVHGE